MDLGSIRRAIKANKSEYDRSELTIRRRQYANKRRAPLARDGGTKKEQLAVIS